MTKEESMSDPNNHALQLDKVSKTYKGKIRALKGIALTVDRGEVFGLLGPNGAGKSTLVKILMTVIKPSEANGTMLGIKVGDKKSLRNVGYLPEHHRFPPYLTGGQVLNYYGALSNIPRRERKQQAARLLDLVGMSKWAKTSVAKYSKGMAQRLGIAQSLINNPDIVFLDEPTDGVDPVGRRDIREILKKLRDEGKTVFLNSHLLGEVEMVCDRVSILLQGNVVREGTIDNLTKDSRRYEIEFQGNPPEQLLNNLENAQLKTQSQNNSQISHNQPQSNSHRLLLPDFQPAQVQSVIDRLRAANNIILRIEQKQDSLEDLFIKAVEENGKSVGGDTAKRGDK